MPLVYSFVAREGVVLAEYTSYSGNFAQVAQRAAARVPQGNPRFTYTAEKYTFNYLSDNGLVFGVVADEDYGR